MPSGAMTSAIQTLERGALPNFRNAYDRHYKTAADKLSDVMELNMPSSKSIEILPYMLAQPHARLWKDGDPAFEGAARSESFTIVNRTWEIRVPWAVNDELFDQINYLVPAIRNAGASMPWIPERVFFQFLNGNADPALLPAIPQAPDGAAMYSATDGTGAARFGFVGGNIVTGSGVATAAQIIADLHAAIAAGQQFQDGQGQPLWAPDVLESAPVLVVYPAKYRLIFAQAFGQRFIADSNAAPSNVILDADMKFKLWGTQRLTGKDWYVFFTGVEKRPLVQTLASPIRQYLATMDNSDWCRNYRTNYLQWDWVGGFGLGPVYQTINIHNP